MLTELYQALITHLSPLGVSVYQADCVPQGAVFPYITLAVTAPLAEGAAGSLTLTAWHDSAQANAGRIAQADALAALLPPRGHCFALETGNVLLLPGSATSCVRDTSILGMRMVWKLRCFPAA